MPKPLFGDNGSGMHCHQSIWRGGKNTFYDASGYAQLSDTAKYYIGGLLKHAPALLALVAPTTNSYRRLVPGFEAPVNLAYSQRNRSAICRIPVGSKSAKSKRVEFRAPDPSCNPYLAFAALLMAGIDGIQNCIDPGEPMDKDLYGLPPEEAQQGEAGAGQPGRGAGTRSRPTTSSCSRATCSRPTCWKPTSRTRARPRSTRSACARIRTSSCCTTTHRSTRLHEWVRRNWHEFSLNPTELEFATIR